MKTKLKAMLAAMVVAAAALGAIACGDTTTQVEGGGNQEQGITVTGQGKATARPDVAMITLGVSSRAATVAEARTQAADALDAMLKSAKANGVADKDLQTRNLSIQPEYDYRDNTPVLRGYVVTNSVTVKVREIDNTSKVVDDAVTAGGDNTRIDSIAFTIDDPSTLQQEAREAAVAEARAKAETLAKASGVDLGDTIRISETSGAVPPVYYADRSEALPATGASTPIQPGELDVTIDVSVTWQIK